MIKWIVFDFGGVYFTYSSQKLMKDLSEELDISVKTIKQAYYFKLKDFVKGKCEENEFWNAFLKKINKKYDKNKLHQTVISQFKPITETQELINKLKKYYQIGLLSNQTDWIDEINKKYKFYKHFDIRIISKNVGTRKPEKKIYKILIKKCNCKPQEIVFIDDNPRKGKPAEELGLNFIHYQNHQQLKKNLEEIGVKIK